MVLHHWPHQPGGAGVLASQRNPTALVPGAFHWAPLEGPAGLMRQLGPAITPSALIMLGGVTHGPGVTERDLEGNRHLALACVEAARVAGIGRVLLASSAAVYGVDGSGAAFAETSLPRPKSAYGRAKLAMEAVGEVGRQAGIEVCVLRIGNVAGADALLAPLTGRSANPKRPLQIPGYADGLGPLRSYIGPATLARVLAALSGHPGPLPQVLNLATPEPVRMMDLARAAGWPYQVISPPANAHQSITLDCSLLASLLPMAPADSLPAEMVRQWKAGWA